MTGNGTTPDLEPAFASILATRRRVSPQRALLGALSEIDASGESYLRERLVTGLEARGFRAVGIGIDGWLNLPQVRFNSSDRGAHFYRHAIRFDELFAQLVLPLRDRRSHHLVADFTEETATVLRSLALGRLQLRHGARARRTAGTGGSAPGRNGAGLPADLLSGPANPLRGR
ncbi:MAG: hypothetical protein ACREMG_07310 [Gemmatimonadales bacterium]